MARTFELRRREDLLTAYAEDELVPSAARTVGGDSGWLDDFAEATGLRVQLDVGAAAGTNPTLDVVVEDTIDGVNANTIGTFTQKTGPGREVINVTGLFGRRIRVRWTIGGTTPIFTFAVNSVAQGLGL